MRLLHFGQLLRTLTQHLKWVSATPYLQLFSSQESPLSFSADTLLLRHAAGLFDGLTKGLESLVGAEEVNLGAPKVAAIDRPLSWTVGMFEVPDPRHPMEDAWFAGKSLNFHAYKYLMSRTKCAATLRRL